MNDLNTEIDKSYENSDSEDAITTLKQAKRLYHGHGAEMNHEACLQLIDDAVNTLTQENSTQRVNDKLSKLDSFLRDITQDDTKIPLADDLYDQARAISWRIDEYFQSRAPSLDNA